MSTFLQNWMNLRAMSAPQGNGGSNIIYQLSNYTCDGTAATAINTGLYLFDTTAYPNGWTIEVDFYFTEFVNQGAVIRCRNASSPYNGISVRSATATSVEVQLNSLYANINPQTNGDHLTATYDYTPSTGVCSIVSRNITTGRQWSNSQSMSGKTVSAVFAVGGEPADNAGTSWKANKFAKCVINSLVIIGK